MIIFSHIHKSGGTTLKWILRNSFGLRHLEIIPIHPTRAYPDQMQLGFSQCLDQAKVTMDPIGYEELEKVRGSFPHVVSLHSHNISPSVDLGEHRWFTFVREPRKQVASWFQYLIEFGGRTDLEFKDYIKSEFPRERQCKMLGGRPSADDAIQVINKTNIFCGVVEEFDASLLLMKRLHIPELNINYSSQGIAKKVDIAKGLLSDKESLRLIDEATVEDRKLYDYVRKEIYPSYLETYGAQLEKDLNAYRLHRTSFSSIRVNLSRLQSRGYYEKLWVPFARNREL